MLSVIDVDVDDQSSSCDRIEKNATLNSSTNFKNILPIQIPIHSDHIDKVRRDKMRQNIDIDIERSQILRQNNNIERNQMRRIVVSTTRDTNIPNSMMLYNCTIAITCLLIFTMFLFWLYLLFGLSFKISIGDTIHIISKKQYMIMMIIGGIGYLLIIIAEIICCVYCGLREKMSIKQILQIIVIFLLINIILTTLNQIWGYVYLYDVNHKIGSHWETTDCFGGGGWIDGNSIYTAHYLLWSNHVIGMFFVTSIIMGLAVLTTVIALIVLCFYATFSSDEFA